MSLSRDALLFGIALILFGNWMQVYGLDAAPFPHIGILLAALAFLGSLVSAILSQDMGAHSTGDG